METSEPLHHGRNSHNQSFAATRLTVVRIVAADVRIIPDCVHESGGRAVRNWKSHKVIRGAIIGPVVVGQVRRQGAGSNTSSGTTTSQPSHRRRPQYCGRDLFRSQLATASTLAYAQRIPAGGSNPSASWPMTVPCLSTSSQRFCPGFTSTRSPGEREAMARWTGCSG